MREVDTLRLVCPRQWMSMGWYFNNNSSSPGKYIGSVNTNWSPNGECLPFDEDLKLRWKSRAADVGVAEWNWSFPYPDATKLRYIWWDPFIMYEKEVTW